MIWIIVSIWLLGGVMACLWVHSDYGGGLRPSSLLVLFGWPLAVLLGVSLGLRDRLHDWRIKRAVKRAVGEMERGE